MALILQHKNQQGLFAKDLKQKIWRFFPKEFTSAENRWIFFEEILITVETGGFSPK